MIIPILIQFTSISRKAIKTTNIFTLYMVKTSVIFKYQFTEITEVSRRRYRNEDQPGCVAIIVFIQVNTPNARVSYTLDTEPINPLPFMYSNTI